MSGFLPMTREEMAERGIERFDFICVTGDAYVDHPSFGVAIISRVLESQGYSVGMIAQPHYHTLHDFEELGAPRYGFFVTSGNIDSMVAHYTSAKRLRSDDAYSPGGKAGKRPDRAVIVYCQQLRKAFGEIPIVIGGLEASLRRFAHYDYWDDEVRPSILIDSGADLLSYGMGERQTVEIASRLAKGVPAGEITDIPGTCYLTAPVNTPLGARECPNFEQVSTKKEAYAKACKIQITEQDEVYGKTVIQRHGAVMLVQNPPMRALTQDEMDAVYALPYMRMYHPSYEKQGGVPAIEEVEFSITHNRGCFGHCNFCSIALHQGRKVTCRSEESVLNEARSFLGSPRFKGYIHDVGGPTANFRHPSCAVQKERGLCRERKCLAPSPCPQLVADHSEYLGLLRKLRALPGIKRVFIRSGIRYDYLMADPDPSFMRELVQYHVSGQLKVAPEHCSASVLDAMGKPHIETYKKFADRFYQVTKEVGKEQYLVPYLMSSHPGSTLSDAIELALFLKEQKIRPEQVQDFYPTPGTLSTCMFYTGLNPMTMEPVYVPKTAEEKAMQRALLQYFRPSNKDLVLKALKLAHRTDLIGTGPNCLVRDALHLSDQARKTAAKGYAKTQKVKQRAAGKLHSKTSKKAEQGRAGRNAAAGKKGKKHGKKKS
ncbi:MAG: YgiQ family radical SAM protein [Oscillospiraceae bacterium]|nr:YgiQ family radical SAM protein [Oscillospiraceae bacterium]